MIELPSSPFPYPPGTPSSAGQPIVTNAANAAAIPIAHPILLRFPLSFITRSRIVVPCSLSAASLPVSTVLSMPERLFRERFPKRSSNRSRCPSGRSLSSKDSRFLLMYSFRLSMFYVMCLFRFYYLALLALRALLAFQAFLAGHQPCCEHLPCPRVLRPQRSLALSSDGTDLLIV